MNIPEGFGVVTPYLFIDDADKYIAFLKSALGAEEVLRSDRPDGKIGNAQLRIGDSMIMLSEASPQYPQGSTAFYLYVENADAAMERAIRHGARLEMKVMDMEYGDRQGGVRDPAGHIWWISQRLTDKAYHD